MTPARGKGLLSGSDWKPVDTPNDYYPYPNVTSMSSVVVHNHVCHVIMFVQVDLMCPRAIVFA